MSKNYTLRDDGVFAIKDYNKTHPFSNFLPGISGEWGIPLWVFYVNRAQGVVSFGIKDKNHAISEFFPANKAYSVVSSLGFRTFIKINKKTYYEPFSVSSSHKNNNQMLVKGASLEIKETNPALGLDISVKYWTLPNTSVASLARVVTVKNISKQKVNLELLDGLPRVVPFGSAHHFLKDMSHTLEAWMNTYIKNNLATFRLIVDPRDVSQTRYIEGANFNYSFSQVNGKKKSSYIIVDPYAIFSQDTSFSCPVNFLDKNFRIPVRQVTLGKTPCAFSHFKFNLKEDEEYTFYNIFGASFKPHLINKFTEALSGPFLKEKEAENHAIIERIKSNASCVSSSNNFNHYIKATYLDNVLRGGYPYAGGKNIYYIFSRKHGDLERDYNFFQLLPSYFSQGQANYRDINQNRRLDLFFEPNLGAKNIIYFMNFIKINGYNPLVIKGEKLKISSKDAQKLLKDFSIKDKRVFGLMLEGFYLGEFFKLLDEEGIKVNTNKKNELLLGLLTLSRREPQAHHGEGYWIDHWHYNLDLIENFLYFYPDKIKDLFLNKEFLFWDDEYHIKKRSARYVLRQDKVYQGESVEAVSEKRKILKARNTPKNFLRTKRGKIYKTTLLCKLLTLILNKFSTLDPHGIGIEMEADKPGWCDSLNGLPAIFGSSLSETFALKRASLILLNVIRMLKEKSVEDISVAYEVFLFFNNLNKLLTAYLCSNSKKRDYVFWDKANSIKEGFREDTFFCVEGKEKKLSLIKLERFIKSLIVKLNLGISKAKDKKSGLNYTYFSYKVTKYHESNKRIMPYEFVKKTLPLHLEGIVHSLRTEGNKDIYRNLRNSKLFDKELKMYRLNASFGNEPLEIGRSRVFVPGWLENESIWLHMEYKYILELLKNGFYEEFFADFYKCVVCFFEPQKYGRSVLENSSFIVSSAYPDKNLWGKGFVARLTGATVELLNMWMLLCLGKAPFYIDTNGGLCMRLRPILKKELFTTKEETIYFEGKKITLPKNTFSFKLFSKTLVSYHNPKRKDTFDKNCRTEKIIVKMSNKKAYTFSSTIASSITLAIRNKEAKRIDVYLK